MYVIIKQKNKTMGNATRTDSFNDSQSNQNIKEYFLPQYGGKVLVDMQNKVVAKTCVVRPDQEPDFLAIVNERMRLNHPNLGKYKALEEIQANDGEAFCGSSIKTYRLTYQLYAYSLFNQIQHHCKIKQPIPEGEVCRIFESVVSCLNYLKSHGTLHGDIKVGSIFLDKDRNVKLIDSFFLKDGKTNYQVVLQDPKSMSLLAPQQLQLLRIKWFDSLQAAEKYQIFMVGLTMIEITTIKQGMRCYNLQKLTINEQFFLHAMNDIQYCGYSFELSNLIMNCVHKIPNYRPTYLQFLAQIRAIGRKCK